MHMRNRARIQAIARRYRECDGRSNEVKTAELQIHDFETKPYGNIIQDDFLNGCFVMRTWMSPEELLTCFHILEDEEGNQRLDVKWGPRALDLDIIFYDDLVYESDDLIIPHVDMENRRYVLEPLSEIAPNKRHPILGTTVRELYEEMAGEEE